MNSKQLCNKLYEMGAIKFGSFTLKSGIVSPIYLDLRLIISYPKLLKEIGEMLWEKMLAISFNRICGVPYTALPLATAISLSHNIPMILKRKEAKDYGTKKMVEGIFKENDVCILIEDVITSGKSILETIEALRLEKLVIRDVMVVIDREQGGNQKLQTASIKVHPLLTITQLLQSLYDDEKIDKQTVDAVLTFIKANNGL